MDDDNQKSALEALAEVLLAHGVEFVVVGGQAEVLFGSPRVTHDVDLCYRRTRRQPRERPRSYGGHQAEDQRRLDVEADLRIANLVREAGYEQAWSPFTAVYAALLREVSEKALEQFREAGATAEGGQGR